jgi:CheY-like chemotaxis protein
MNNPAAPRVLLADDNIDAAELTGQLLEFHGIKVRCVFDGAAAVAQVATFQPDVVVLDIGMPELDGHATFRAIRASAGGARLPIVALTAYNSAAEARRIQETGFSAHLVKPCEIALLLATIRELSKTGKRAQASSRRTDELTAQRIEVALVYQQMLGTVDAQDYLSSLGVPESVARRVLQSDATRVSPWVNEEP